jgi:hypothetical protein
MKTRKSAKRFTLHRETLIRLDPGRLDAAVGGGTALCNSTRPICCTASDSCPPPTSADCSFDFC